MTKRLHLKSKQLKSTITETGRKGAKKDFFTLLKLAIEPKRSKTTNIAHN